MVRFGRKSCENLFDLIFALLSFFNEKSKVLFYTAEFQTGTFEFRLSKQMTKKVPFEFKDFYNLLRKFQNAHNLKRKDQFPVGIISFSDHYRKV